MLIPYKFKALAEGGQYETKEFNFPTEWKDLTFEQGVRLFVEWYSGDREDVFLLLSILSGVEPFYWENATGNIERDVLPNLKFISEPIDLEAVPFPKIIKIGDQDIELPKNIQLETLAQKVKLQKDINANVGKPHDLFLICPTAVATYAYPLFYKQPLNMKKLITFVDLVKKANFLDVYSAGRFFFLKSLN